MGRKSGGAASYYEIADEIGMSPMYAFKSLQMAHIKMIRGLIKSGVTAWDAVLAWSDYCGEPTDALFKIMPKDIQHMLRNEVERK